LKTKTVSQNDPLFEEATLRGRGRHNEQALKELAEKGMTPDSGSRWYYLLFYFGNFFARRTSKQVTVPKPGHRVGFLATMKMSH
jgi:hypothetical protein